MPLPPRSPRLAVLIDAENVSARIADGLFKRIAGLGEANVRHVYGDFSGPRLKGWSEILAGHAIIARQQFADTPGKNASDIALVIEAMDLLHSGKFDGFCIVSSDSDFTSLAVRMRNEGAKVFGFGEHKTPESFRQACNRFEYTETLIAVPVTPSNSNLPQPKLLRSVTAATAIIDKVMAQMESEDGWIALAEIGSQLANKKPPFDSHAYGFSSLSKLVRDTKAYETRCSEGSALSIRVKPERTKQKAAQQPPRLSLIKTSAAASPSRTTT